MNPKVLLLVLIIPVVCIVLIEQLSRSEKIRKEIIQVFNWSNSESPAGIYSADYPEAFETLRLEKDGTFTQAIALKGRRQEVRAAGRWEYSSKRGYITFSEEFLSVLDPFGHLNPEFDKPHTGVTMLPLENHFGRRIIVASESVEYVKK